MVTATEIGSRLAPVLGVACAGAAHGALSRGPQAASATVITSRHPAIVRGGVEAVRPLGTPVFDTRDLRRRMRFERPRRQCEGV